MMRKPTTLLAAAMLAAAVLDAGAQEPESSTLPRYRYRLLGVYNAQTGDPVAGAEVMDVLNKNKSLTSATGTVTLSFLPEGGTMVRIQKIGFTPETNVIAISESDTVPVMIMLKPMATALPAVLTTETARKYTSPALNAFEERRLKGFGKFITEEKLRKNDSRSMTNLVREIGVMVTCEKRPPYGCYAASHRQASKNVLMGGSCSFDMYYDGVPMANEQRNLNEIRVNEIGAVESYNGPSQIPPQFNKTGSVCGVILFWSREK